MNGCSLLHPLKEYSGPDLSIEISLKEYGIAWFNTGKEWHFLYGVRYDNDNMDEWSTFDTGWFDIDTDVRREFSWMDDADWKGLFSFIGHKGTLDEYIGETTFPNIVHDIVRFFGRENVFGGTYGTGYTWEDLERL